MINTLRNTARHVRQTVLAGIRSLGMFEYIASSSWRHRRLLILCYHGVSLQDEHEWHTELFVTPDFLRHRFEMLRDGGYTVLPLGEAVNRLRDGTLPERSVALTFDDGFYNFYAAALPLLEEFGFAATVYLTSYHCLNQRPILGLTIRYMLWRARHQVLPAKTLFGQDNPVELGYSRQREQLAAQLIVQARTLSGDREAQQAWLGRLAAQLGVDWNNLIRDRLLHLMTEAEVTDAAQRGVDIQLHTHHHKTPRDESAFRNELIENKNIIDNLTGGHATHFCYPSGDTDPVFLPWLRDFNVQTGTTCVVGLAKAEHDPLLLPRFIDTMAQTDLMFEGWLSGTAEFFKGRSI